MAGGAAPLLAAILLVTTASPLLALTPVLPRVENGHIRLPPAETADIICYYRKTADPDPARNRRLLALVESGRVLPANVTMDDAGPELFAMWEDAAWLRLRTSVKSDTVAFSLRVPGVDNGPSGALLAPGLVDTLRAMVDWRPFIVHDVGRIRRLEFVNKQDRRFTCQDEKILARLAQVFRIAPSTPDGCPFSNHLRLETDAGVLFCSIAADGCEGTLLVAPPSAELEAAWREGGEAVRDAMHSMCTQYAITRESYAIVRRLAHSNHILLADNDSMSLREIAADLYDYLVARIKIELRRWL